MLATADLDQAGLIEEDDLAMPAPVLGTRELPILFWGFLVKVVVQYTPQLCSNYGPYISYGIDGLPRSADMIGFSVSGLRSTCG